MGTVAILMWFVQIIAFLVVWKVVHLLFWNLRKGAGASSLVWAMVMTFVIAVLGVIIAHTSHTAWAILLGVSVLLGIANGEYEYNRELTR